jgi:hypothetical protein
VNLRKEETMTGNGPHDEVLDAAVIGGSQAGLTMAWHLVRPRKFGEFDLKGIARPMTLCEAVRDGPG